jgi:hypothetical protein
MTALTLYEDGKFEVMQRTAKALAASGYFSDARDISQAIVKVMAGAELGLPPFASMTGIHIIQGKPVLGANVLATLIKNDPRYDYRVLELTEKVCRIEFYEHGKPCGVSVFTAEDAKKAGTKNMDKNPRNMLFARSISNGAKWYTPGVFGGAPVYTPDDFGLEVDADGVIIDGDYSETAHHATAVTEPVVMQQAPPAKSQVTREEYTEDEATIAAAAAADFFDIATALIDRYDHVNATKNAATPTVLWIENSCALAASASAVSKGMLLAITPRGMAVRIKRVYRKLTRSGHHTRLEPGNDNFETQIPRPLDALAAGRSAGLSAGAGTACGFTRTGRWREHFAQRRAATGRPHRPRTLPRPRLHRRPRA